MDDIHSRVLFSHPIGNANSRAALGGLSESGELAEFHTALAVFRGNLWSALAKLPFASELNRRRFSDHLRRVTKQYPMREIGRVVSLVAGARALTRRESGLFDIDSVFRTIDRGVSRTIRNASFSAVYAYEDGAYCSFRAAKQKHVKCLYDLPIGYWRTARRLMAEERCRWPDWDATMPGFLDSDAKLERKDQELLMADQIFVASSFTAKSLEDFPLSELAPIHVIPYGFPSPSEKRDYDNIANRKLRLLFVGGLTQRKGIADVFAVADALCNDVELTVIGRGNIDQCPALKLALARHRWIPSLPHDQILEQMRSHDVLLFPSLFEGFGLVITEAMSQGTPVITTDRTAGGDLLEHGKSGWLIPAGDTNALIEQVRLLLDDPEGIPQVGREAIKLAAKRPWSAYGNELAAKIAETIGT